MMQTSDKQYEKKTFKICRGLLIQNVEDYTCRIVIYKQNNPVMHFRQLRVLYICRSHW